MAADATPANEASPELPWAAPGPRRSVKTSEAVMVLLVRDMVARGLTTGDRLPTEAAMMRQYGVSRASLREATRLLEVQGLITLKPGPGGGAAVGAADYRNFARTATLYLHLGGLTYGELTTTQEVLEPLLAEAAARNPDTVAKRTTLAPYLSDDIPAEGPEYRRLSSGFHDAVARLAANGVLALLARSLSSIVTSHVTAHMDPVELRAAILDQHRAIARAICAGQHQVARRLMAEHYADQHAYLAERWPNRLGEIVERP
jgi:GntR family transcriptional repressor for pyruvate dehydrogenase complex